MQIFPMLTCLIVILLVLILETQICQMQTSMARESVIQIFRERTYLTQL